MASGVGVAKPESDAGGMVSTCFVRLGSGDAGREGGSWVGSGVDVSEAMVENSEVGMKAVRGIVYVKIARVARWWDATRHVI